MSVKDTTPGNDTSTMDTKGPPQHDATVSSDFINSGVPMGHVPSLGADLIQKKHA